MPEDGDDVNENSGADADPVNVDSNGTLSVAAVELSDTFSSPKTEKLSEVPEMYIPVDGSEVKEYAGTVTVPFSRHAYIR